MHHCLVLSKIGLQCKTRIEFSLKIESATYTRVVSPLNTALRYSPKIYTVIAVLTFDLSAIQPVTYY